MARVRSSARSLALVAACMLGTALQAQPPQQSPAQPPPVQQTPAPIVRAQPAPQYPPLDESAQPPTAPNSPPSEPFRLAVNAREVVLDVVVSDGHGHPVKGLKAADFALAEDGVPQQMLSLQEHNAMTAEAIARLTPPAKLARNEFSSETPVPENTNAVTVILIDALESKVTDQMYLEQQIVGFVKQLPPGHVFAIFKLDYTMHLVQGFTVDRDALLQSVNSKRNWPSLDILRGGRNFQQRKAIVSEGLATMSRYMAGVPGRKNLVWFTGDVPPVVVRLSNNPFPDAVDYDARTDEAANVLSLSQVAIYPIDDRGLQVSRTHPLTADRMDEIAERTGGKATHNNNGLKQALEEITDTSSDYYTIAYAPTNHTWNAHHRTIELTVPGSRDQLLYRHIYYARKERPEQRRADRAAAQGHAYVPQAAAPLPEAADNADTEGEDNTPQNSLGDAMTLGGLPSSEVLFTVSVAPAAGTQKLKKDDAPPQGNFLRADLLTKPFRLYSLLYTVDPGRLTLTPGDDGLLHAVVDYAVVVYSPEGEVLNSLISTSTIQMTQETYEKALHGERKITSHQEIAAPVKGNDFLRIAVHDTQSNAIGALEVPLDAIRP